MSREGFWHSKGCCRRILAKRLEELYNDSRQWWIQCTREDYSCFKHVCRVPNELLL